MMLKGPKHPIICCPFAYQKIYLHNFLSLSKAVFVSPHCIFSHFSHVSSLCFSFWYHYFSNEEINLCFCFSKIVPDFLFPVCPILFLTSHPLYIIHLTGCCGM